MYSDGRRQTVANRPKAVVHGGQLSTQSCPSVSAARTSTNAPPSYVSPPLLPEGMLHNRPRGKVKKLLCGYFAPNSKRSLRP